MIFSRTWAGVRPVLDSRPENAAVMIAAKLTRAAHSSVLTRTAMQIGGSFGTTVLAVILEGAVAAHPATLADAFHVAFWWSAGFSAVAVLLALWLPGAQRAPAASHAGLPDQRTDPVGT